VVTTKPLRRSASRTMVIIRRREENNHPSNEKRTAASATTTALFVGEFPRQIEASEVSWRVVSSSSFVADGNNIRDNEINTKDDNNDHEAAPFSSVDIVFRLPYSYDPSITPSNTSTAASSSTLDEINNVLCGSCHQPLIFHRHNHGTPTPTNNDAKSLSAVTTTSAIRRVFPLPSGHWDEIVDYLICYDGQPVVDFSAGSECAEPSMALQDASLLCFHRRDVQQAVCALAVDGYGELTERNNNHNNNPNKHNNNDDDRMLNDLGSFGKKPQSSLFVLPEPQQQQVSRSSNSSDGSRLPATAGDEEKKDERGDDGEKISPYSTVVRGDRSWQDATDGESVSLCCGRCCAPLGFASLGSPETWRFWKHRLCLHTGVSVPKTNTKTKPSKQLPSSRIQERENEKKNKGKIGEEKCEESMSRATTMAIPATNDPCITNMMNHNLNNKPFNGSMLRPTRPLGSCSSFLARELVRYAESKAIFTFIVRCEDDDDAESSLNDNAMDGTIKPRDENKCLLLRLLSWETTMAKSFVDDDVGDGSYDDDHESMSSLSRSSYRLKFQRVAKIVFEETADPTANKAVDPSTTHSTNDGSSLATTQWFWGGVDLCCPPPSAPGINVNNSTASPTTISGDETKDEKDPVSTVRLQLPRDEYDRVLANLVFGRSCFQKEVAEATIVLKMGGVWKGLGLTAVALE